MHRCALETRALKNKW